jgi:hypothetical protein
VIRHIVLFRLTDKADASAAAAQLRSLEGKIPSLRSIEVGVNVVESERAHDVSIMTTFDDLAGLKEYAEHPEHQPVVRWMRERVAGSAAVDYET